MHGAETRDVDLTVTTVTARTFPRADRPTDAGEDGGRGTSHADAASARQSLGAVYKTSTRAEEFTLPFSSPQLSLPFGLDQV